MRQHVRSLEREGAALSRECVQEADFLRLSVGLERGVVTDARATSASSKTIDTSYFEAV